MSEVSELYQHLRAHYASTHAKMNEADRLVRQLVEGMVDVPYEVRIFKSSTAANIVESFRNQIRTNQPTVIFRPAGVSIAAEKHAILMQKWGYGQLRKERERTLLDPNLQCGGDLLLRGAACKKILVDVDSTMEPPPRRGTNAFKDWEARAIHAWPFVVKAIDPLSMFPIPSSTKPFPGFIEHQVRYTGDLVKDYPEWSTEKRRKNPTTPVTWLEYWTDERYVVEADGDPVFDRENPYGLSPYIFEWSGFGRIHANGDPSSLAVGILTDVMGELEEEIRLKTAISVQTQMHVFPPILTVDDPVSVAKQFGVGPGKVIRHPPGHPPEYMQYPPPNENMYRFLEVIQSNISRVASAALSGGRDSGVRYGVLQAQQIGQALTSIAPVIETIDKIGTETLNMMLRMARKLDLHMTVEGTLENAEAAFRVSGKDFTHENFDVSFEAVDPAENDRALLVGASLRRARDISRKTLWSKYAKHIVEDPDQEEINLLEEATMEQLVASGQLGLAVLSEDVQAQMIEQQTQAVDNVQGQVQGQVQGEGREDVPISAQRDATELEAISGRPGSSTIPRETAEAGFSNASPSRSGLPQTGQTPQG